MTANILPPLFPFVLLLTCPHSGLVHLLAGMVVEQMVLLCFLEARYLNFLKFVKFLELLGGNMLATTNLAICINLALIVRVSLDSDCEEGQLGCTVAWCLSRRRDPTEQNNSGEYL